MKKILIILVLGLILISGCNYNKDSIQEDSRDIDPELKKASAFVTEFTYNEEYGLDDNFTLLQCLSGIMYSVEKETTKLVKIDNIYGLKKDDGMYRVTINYKKGDNDIYFTFDTNMKKIYAINNNADVVLKKLKDKYYFAYMELREYNQERCDEPFEPLLKDDEKYRGEIYRKVRPESCDGKIDGRYCFKGDSFIY